MKIIEFNHLQITIHDNLDVTFDDKIISFANCNSINNVITELTKIINLQKVDRELIIKQKCQTVNFIIYFYYIFKNEYLRFFNISKEELYELTYTISRAFPLMCKNGYFSYQLFGINAKKYKKINNLRSILKSINVSEELQKLLVLRYQDRKTYDMIISDMQKYSQSMSHYCLRLLFPMLPNNIYTTYSDIANERYELRNCYKSRLAGNNYISITQRLRSDTNEIPYIKNLPEIYQRIIKAAPKFVKMGAPLFVTSILINNNNTYSYTAYYSDHFSFNFPKFEKCKTKSEYLYYMYNARSDKDQLDFKLHKFTNETLKKFAILVNWNPRKAYNLTNAYSFVRYLSDAQNMYKLYNNIIKLKDLNRAPNTKFQLQYAEDNHKTWDKCYKQIHEAKFNQPMPDFSSTLKLPDTLKQFMMKKKIDLINAGEECHNCIGHYIDSKDSLFFRKDNICLQAEVSFWYEYFHINIVQCYDACNKITSDSESFKAFVSEELKKTIFIKNEKKSSGYLLSNNNIV